MAWRHEPRIDAITNRWLDALFHRLAGQVIADA
jgi:hypothetical protein